MSLKPWHAFAAFLGWNYSRHRRGLSTFCSDGREHVPPWAAALIWAGFNTWLLPHWFNNYRPRT